MNSINSMNTSSFNFSSIATLLSATREAQSTVAYDRNEVMSWEAFQCSVAALKATLEANKAQRIALCFGNSYLFTISFLACCHANKSIVLPGNYQPEALKELDEHYDLVLHDAEVAIPDELASLNITTTSEPISCEWQQLAPRDIAITMFTSGSSGKPKAINKTLQQLDVEVAILEGLWGEKLQGSCIESTVSHQHIYGLLFRILWPLCSARPFAAHNLEFPEQILHCATADTTLISSPALLKRLVGTNAPSALRCVFSSGGPLPNDAATHSQQLFGDLPIEIFGSTETGGIAYRQQQSPTQPWTLFPGVEAALNHENCLKLRSPHIDESAWYQTADECYFHDSISFELRGRTDRIVKVEEKRVSLVEVEKRLEQLPWIKESAIVPMEEKGRLCLYAVIVLTNDGDTTQKEIGKGKFWLALRKALRDWLEPIAIPRKFRIVNEIPLNSQGKRQVAEIEKLFQE